jgi:hypothetical protein
VKRKSVFDVIRVYAGILVNSSILRFGRQLFQRYASAVQHRIPRIVPRRSWRAMQLCINSLTAERASLCLNSSTKLPIRRCRPAVHHFTSRLSDMGALRSLLCTAFRMSRPEKRFAVVAPSVLFRVTKELPILRSLICVIAMVWFR